jgi:hypothetical protein
MEFDDCNEGMEAIDIGDKESSEIGEDRYWRWINI